MEVLKVIAVHLCSPLVMAALLAVTGWVLTIRLRRHAAKHCFLAAAAILTLFSQPLVSDLLLFPLEHMGREPPKEEYARSQIYVLACYYNTTENVPEIARWSECSLQRLAAAARLHHKYGGDVVVSGAENASAPGVIYAEKAGQFLKSLGVPANKITRIKGGGTTAGEIALVSPLIANRPTLVVSSATHIHRLRLLFPHSYKLSYYPVDFLSTGELNKWLSPPALYALEFSRRAIYEYVALTKDYFFR
ncbi:YdcF family protein [Alteromonas sp. ASW11-19]|uniref:YdcF family protein n=1 Tax=Alteromonas salexigens TaxID=2982530 RepID=A0ABT2VQQ5_9ALTE|nr:YdcF family protein [Alteromonas salexigens]MCU7555640.1 YdcF family protein [Alteromonas salexigens]